MFDRSFSRSVHPYNHDPGQMLQSFCVFCKFNAKLELFGSQGRLFYAKS